MKKVRTNLKTLNFNLIVDLHHNMRSLVIKRALKVPSKSVDKLNIKKFLLTTFKWNLMPPIHMVDRNVATIEHLGVKNDMQGLDFFIPDTEKFTTAISNENAFCSCSNWRSACY